MHRKYRKLVSAGLVLTMAGAMMLQGCGQKKETGKTEIELVQYKPEAVKTFEKIEEEFNRTHDDIHLTIESPNDAMTVLKTRFIREDNPDIIGIGGEVSYSNFIDSDWMISKKHTKKLIKTWSLFRKRELMQSRMRQMQQEFFTTKQCSKNMDGRFRQHGMNS